MHPLLQISIAELRLSPIVLGTEPGSGGAENLWSVTLPDEIDEPQLVEFLREALRVRQLQASDVGCLSVVFYVWHDEMAGQVRFSLARGTAHDLPFTSPVELVSELNEIAQSYVRSEYRRGIPWDQLDEVHSFVDEDIETHAVRVWATQLT